MTTHHGTASSRCLTVGVLGALVLGSLLTRSGAQVPTTLRPDGTLGTTVTTAGTVHTIAGGTITGGNQFHSFDRFSVGTGDTARFTGPVGITNILSRVTGGQQSVIDGKLQSTIPQANLYLLNPSGVVFGPHASLDVSGSFHVSTADALRFADGATFAAHLGTQSALTVAHPTAFGFLGPNPSGIAVRGSTLSVPPGKALSLVGGDIEIIGDRPTNTNPPAPPNVAAPGGQITITSVASAGEVGVPTVGQTPGLDMGAFARLGTVTLRDNARLEASGPRGGTVVIRGGRLAMDGGQMVANTGEEPGASPGIDMQLTDTVTVSGPDSGLFTETAGQAPGGDIVLHARAVQLTDGATISALSTGLSTGTGDAGNVHIQAAESLLVRGGSTVTTAAPEADGGNIRVTAENGIVRLTDSHISAEVNQEDGQGGRVTITAAAVIVERSQVLTRAGPGTGGDIIIDGALVFDGTFVSGQPCAFNPAGSCLDASGRVSLARPDPRSGTVAPLPHTLVPATALLRERCAARRRGGRASSLVLAGRDGVPVQPGEVLPSPLYRAEHGRPATTEQTSASSPAPPARRVAPGSATQTMTRLEGRRAHGIPPMAWDPSCAPFRREGTPR